VDWVVGWHGQAGERGERWRIGWGSERSGGWGSGKGFHPSRIPFISVGRSFSWRERVDPGIASISSIERTIAIVTIQSLNDSDEIIYNCLQISMLSVIFGNIV
jgi:hypothetical protein